MTSVVLVDDHPPLRAGVAAIIARSGRYEVAAEAGTIEEAVLAIRVYQPQIVIVDVTLPDGSGIDLTRSLRASGTVNRVLILSMHARRSLADSALAAGADGYLLKESTPEYLLHALDEISAGSTFLDHRLRRVGTDSRGNERGPTDSPPGATGEPLGRLTVRELEIFRYLAAGKNSKQIAALLAISSKTVDNHRAKIMVKLQLASVADLVRLAIRTETIEP
ncbi:MAG TPA: response regulator transcription factor [Spirochaetia bacterium]|nr:response regulator transcription factor [Spirochaetia bacterium]